MSEAVRSETTAPYGNRAKNVGRKSRNQIRNGGKYRWE